MGLLSISVPEDYGGMGMGFVSTMLVCDYISGSSGPLQPHMVPIQELEPCL